MSATLAGAIPAAAHGDTNAARRADIQALRGLAVLAVLFYHAQSGSFFSLGYLGVDVFFVLSGYLVTGIVKRDIERGTFSFAAFYLRRARRLLPAAYLVFAAVLVAAPFFLSHLEFASLLTQLAGALSFSANVVLWKQTGYFETEAALKPLLHVWSLSLEEQYYLALPLALALTPPKFWTRAAAAVFGVSLIAWMLSSRTMPGAAFYLLPTRAWELALGSIGALAFSDPRPLMTMRLLAWPAMGILAGALIFSPAWAPGFALVLVCVCTLVVLLARLAPSDAPAPVVWLAWVGDISYSLYLVHWPLFAFANNAYVSPPPPSVRIGLFFASFALAYALNRFVEVPIRTRPLPAPKQAIGIALVATLMLALLAFALMVQERPQDPAQGSVRRANVGMSGDCDFAATFNPTESCRSAPVPRLMVWGDSNAMHLVAGIDATAKGGVLQATKTLCGPLLGVAPIPNSSQYGKDWPDDCMAFNRSVLDYIARNPSIEVVVLASWLGQYAPGNTLLVEAPAGSRSEVNGSLSQGLEGLRRTISAIRDMGRKVVVVAPAPGSNFDVARCLELRSSGRWVFGADYGNCDISVVRYKEVRQPVLELLAHVASDLDVRVIRFDPILCDAIRCAANLQGVPLYRDTAHFSYEGSRAVAAQMELGTQVFAQAR